MVLIQWDRQLHFNDFRAQGPIATGADDLAMLLLQMLWLPSLCAILNVRSLAIQMLCIWFLKGGSVKRLFGGVRVLHVVDGRDFGEHMSQVLILEKWFSM